MEEEPPIEQHEDTDWIRAPTRPLTRQQKRKTGPATTLNTTNSFATLSYEEAENIEGTDFKPLVITHMKIGRRTKTRKARKDKGDPGKLADTMNNDQNIRHPYNATKHITPEYMQYMMTSNATPIRTIQTTIIHQTALVRSARESIGPDLNTLDDTDDEKFLHNVQARVSRTPIAPSIHKTTPITTPLHAIHNSDRQLVEKQLALAWIDYATRAYMPLLYTLWPDETILEDHPLRWLPSPDNTFPCLDEESLTALLNMPSTQPIWRHATQQSRELKRAIQLMNQTTTTSYNPNNQHNQT